MVCSADAGARALVETELLVVNDAIIEYRADTGSEEVSQEE